MNTPIPRLSRGRKRLKHTVVAVIVLLVLLLILRAVFLSTHAVGRAGGGRHAGFAQFTGPLPVQDDVPITLADLGTAGTVPVPAV